MARMRSNPWKSTGYKGSTAQRLMVMMCKHFLYNQLYLGYLMDKLEKTIVTAVIIKQNRNSMAKDIYF